ncbi:DHH family phosphoesterase, partial [[Eubacterium] cellulosolvens]
IILTGIMFDSGYFSIATPSTFKIASALCESGARLERSRILLQSPMDRSERIARFKGAKRSAIKDLGDWIFATSEVNSHQASAARALIGLGADVAMVQGGEKNYRINFRASSAFSEKTKIHLGNDVAGELGKVFDGEGGGHDRAAGFNLKKSITPPEKLTNEVLRILKQKISSPEKKKPKKE